jgi:hypothetical protein
MSGIKDLVKKILRQSSDENWLKSTIKFESMDSKATFSPWSYLNSPIVWIVLTIAAFIVIIRIFHFSQLTFGSFILVIIVLSYIRTHYDCINEMEAEELIMMSEENPCKKYYGQSDLAKSIFGSYKHECREYMKKTQTSNNNICDPLEVFGKMIAKLQITIFGEMFHGLNKILSGENFISRSFTKILIYLFVIALIFGVIYCLISFGVIRLFAYNNRNIQQPPVLPAPQHTITRPSQTNRLQNRDAVQKPALQASKQDQPKQSTIRSKPIISQPNGKAGKIPVLPGTSQEQPIRSKVSHMKNIFENNNQK